MDNVRKGKQETAARSIPGAHEWEMISGFVLSLSPSRAAQNTCLLEPIAVALLPYGLTEDLLCEVSTAVERAGEDLRSNCPEGKLNCINVRIHMSSLALRGADSPQPWCYFLTKQIASSESDSLDGIDNPYCYIDLHVY